MDYIKLFIISIDIDRLLGLSFLDFKVEVSTSTGELREYKATNYHHCKIKVFDSGLVQFSGSIHKMWNSLNGIIAPKNEKKGFNGNDFTTNDIYSMRDHLTTLFDCKPVQMVFRNVEFGVNVQTNFLLSLFLKGLLYHHSVIFEYKFKQSYYQCKHDRYIIKIYDKGNQYGMKDNTIRVEIKVTRMEEIKGLEIATFADITNSTLEKAYKHLLKRFDEVVYYDRSINKYQLTKLELIKIKDYSNQSYWMDLDSRLRDRPKKKLNLIIEKYSDRLKEQIRNSLIKKCVIINQLSEKAKCVINNSSSILLNITHSAPRYCLVTGIDISMQNASSKYLSNTGLKYLELNDPKLFLLLKNSLLTGNVNKFEKDVYSMMSKQIRNRGDSRPPIDPNQLGISF
jgi:hypothetical protein